MHEMNDRDSKHSGRTIPVGQAVETDTAIPITPAKNVRVAPLSGEIRIQVGLSATLVGLNQTWSVAADPFPAVTLRQVLTFRGSTPDGQLVESVALPWFTIMQIIQRDPDEIYRIEPSHWEELIAGAYHESGLFDDVVLTPGAVTRGAATRGAT